MNKGKLLLVLFIISIISCTTDIDIKTKSIEPHLVVFSALSTNSTRHYVNISKSMEYFSTDKAPVIPDALVTISYQNITDTFIKDSVEGRYYLDFVDLQETWEYTLDIFLDFDGDSINEHYQGRSIMPNSPRIDSVELSDIVINKMPIMFLYGEAYHTTENNFALYFWKNSDTIGIFDFFIIMPDIFLITTGYKYPIPYFIKENIYVGDTLYCRVDNLNNQYSYFMSRVISEINIPTPFFSSPPAHINSNIKCLDKDIPVLGYFTTYSKGEEFNFISDIEFIFLK